MVDKIDKGDLTAPQKEQNGVSGPIAGGKNKGNNPPDLLLSKTGSPLMRGILWAEVLGRPLCKRKGRGRYGL